VTCTSCHFAPNNPGKVGVDRKELPFLSRDPRRLPISEFIHRPDHDLTATRCERCHNPMATHDLLPYKDRHLARLACSSCHTPQLHGPALRTVDATVVTVSGEPRVEYRNMDAAAGGNVNARYITPYQPFLFVDPTDKTLAPFNLVTQWRWVSGPSKQEVPLATVASVYLDQGAYAKDVLTAFDRDGNGGLSYDELRLDTSAKVDLIKSKLASRGVVEPAIAGVVTSHRVHHGVMANDWVERRCDSCHEVQSRLNQDVPLSSYQLAGITPELSVPGQVERSADGGLLLRRTREASGFYVLGHDRVPWTDSLGFVVFLATVIGISVHGAMRYRLRRKQGSHGETRMEYVYSAYERIWHWLMALSILLLLWTGIEIHWVGAVSILGFTRSVLVHNVLAAILIGNAFLSLFYHLASNDIRQFIPPRATFFGEAVAQARYYLNGIFVGAPHPVPKSLQRKLNPLQQVTYLMLLNILIPFQVITGALIWGAPRWPGLSSMVGGLTIITPMHSFGAWLLATFVVTHVYLTTTGHTPLSNIKAMIGGHDEIEVSSSPAHEGGQP
jgi:thiosulfate reductase cytochrome b subunit